MASSKMHWRWVWPNPLRMRVQRPFPLSGHVRAPSLNNSLEKHSIQRILTIYICGLLQLCNASRDMRGMAGRRCGSGSQTFSASNLNNRPQISLLFFICSPSAATVVCDDAVLQYVYHVRYLLHPSIHSANTPLDNCGLYVNGQFSIEIENYGSDRPNVRRIVRWTRFASWHIDAHSNTHSSHTSREQRNPTEYSQFITCGHFL